MQLTIPGILAQPPPKPARARCSPRLAARTSHQPKEYKLVALRECVAPMQRELMDTPERAADYWRLNIPSHPLFNPELESFFVILVDTRRRVLGHHLVSMGTMDTILVSPREVFRLALLTPYTSALILAHNHPSGDPSPSESDIRVTRDLMRAGQLMKIDVIDHIILGVPDPNGNTRGFCSLRELGYFY